MLVAFSAQAQYRAKATMVEIDAGPYYTVTPTGTVQVAIDELDAAQSNQNNNVILVTTTQAAHTVSIAANTATGVVNAATGATNAADIAASVLDITTNAADIVAVSNAFALVTGTNTAIRYASEATRDTTVAYTASSWVAITGYNDSVVENTNEFVAATGIFTAPVDGIYLFWTIVFFDPTPNTAGFMRSRITESPGYAALNNLRAPNLHFDDSGDPLRTGSTVGIRMVAGGTAQAQFSSSVSGDVNGARFGVCLLGVYP